MINNWPYSDIHELNLDWILSKVKELDDKVNNDIDAYINAYIDEHLADFTVSANYDAATETIVYTNGTSAVTTLGDVIRFAIDNVFVDIKDSGARNSIAAINSTIAGLPAGIEDLIFPIGAEYVTSTNTAPTFSGTWTLVGKDFTDSFRALDASEYTDGTNGTVGSIQMRRTGHEILLRITMSNVDNIGDPTANLCNISLAALGVSQLGYGDQNTTILSDTGNVICTMVSHSTGVIDCTDAFVISNPIAHTYSGPLSPFDIIIPIQSSYMLDSACNRFVWRRTA